MEDNLIELLESFDYQVIRQGSLGENEDYPDTFFTFWNNQEYEKSAYDNDSKLVIHDFDVNVYSNNPSLAYSLLKQARKLLKDNNYQIIDRGHDLTSDVDTHIGRGINVTYIQTILESEE